MENNDGIADFAKLTAIDFTDWVRENVSKALDKQQRKFKWKLHGDEKLYTSQELYQEYLKTKEI